MQSGGVTLAHLTHVRMEGCIKDLGFILGPGYGKPQAVSKKEDRMQHLYSQRITWIIGEKMGWMWKTSQKALFATW